MRYLISDVSSGAGTNLKVGGSQWRRLHGAQGHVPPPLLQMAAHRRHPRVEEQQTRN